MGEERNFYDDVPSSPHVQMPASLKSNIASDDPGEGTSGTQPKSPKSPGSDRVRPELHKQDSTVSSISAASMVAAVGSMSSISTVAPKISLSPPPAVRPRNRRLGTLQRLHDRCRSMDVMHMNQHH